MSFGDEYGAGPGQAGEADTTTTRTRTRLPENDTPRRPQRTSRSLVTVVGVVVLLIAAIAFANRDGGTGDGDSRSTGTDGAAAAPTAATGVKPVTGKTGTIPTGYPQDEQGAQSAAANYAVALGSDGMFQRESRRAIIRTVHAPGVADALVTRLDDAYSGAFLTNVGLNEDGSPPEGLTFVSRTIPVGTSLTEMGGGKATVEVWCTGLVGLAGEGSTKPVTETWFTMTQHLRWVDGDWKIESSTQQEGPTPVSGDNRASTADEIADAVIGYGGFTYAR
ncbi:hypothetical protein BJP40_05000 [Streptomyces sp. CC53]|uniref:hypothetical protein n=1 Tax=unclassified Streptomyces TaxID=2593676 RepID=UPI0008DCD6CE|nr:MULTISPECIES: hypothetical protein [unclassified Streptomyces]OII61520.1 hypothetical protein BJP40_05000 [Streptomyces sp. CC53]